LNRRNLFGGVWLAVLAVACTAVLGAASEDLQRAIDLYNAQDYVQARDVLQSLDPAALADDERTSRAEYLGRAQQAARLQVKAQQDLVDAQAALSAGNLDQAQQLFDAVEQNDFAMTGQKAEAVQALQLIAQKRELSQSAEPTVDAAAPPVPAVPAPAAAAEPVPAEMPVPAEVPAPVMVPVPAAPPATQPATRDMDAQRQAALLVDQARELMQAGDYDAADARLVQALQIVPNLPEAVEVQRRVAEARLSLPASTLVSRIRQTNRLQWDLAVRKYRDLEQQILRDVNNHEFDEARRKILQARQVIAAARPYADSPEIYQALLADTSSLDEFVAQEERVYNEQRVREMYVRATQEEIARRQLAEETRQRQVQELMAEAQRLYRERKYEDAVETLKQVLAISPDYELARWLKTDWEEMAIHKREKALLQDMQRERQYSLIEADESMIPWHVFVKYPDNWPEVTRRQERYGAFERMEDEASRKARSLLDANVAEISFEAGVTFSDAIDRIRADSGLNIFANWNALQQYGITRDQEVTVPRMTNVSWRQVLEMLLKQVSASLGGVTQLDWTIEGGVLTISTSDDLNQSANMRTQVYDIGDLLMPRKVVQQGTGFNLTGQISGAAGAGGAGGATGGATGGGATAGGGGGTGTGGGTTGGSSTSGTTETQRSITDMQVELQDLITQTVQPTSWIAAGGTGEVRVWNDRVLIIRQTPRGHEEIRTLLTQLREILAIQIAVEARFLTVSRNFLREIGVDLDIVLNQGTAGFDRTAIIDPGTGTPVLMPRQFGRTGVLPNVPTAFPWSQGQPLGQTVPAQPYGTVGLVPLPGSLAPHSSQFTPLPITNNTINLASPNGITTNVPGSFAGTGFTPGLTFQGSFLDNIQLDFLIRATEADRRSTILTAPRVVLRNTQSARVEVQTLTAYVSNVTPVVASGVATGGAQIGLIPTGSTLWVQAAVSSDLKYVLLDLEPYTTRLVSLVSFQPVTGIAAGGGTGGATVGGGGGGVSTFNIQLPIQELTAVVTQVSVPDGGTLLMGGQKLVGEVEIEAGVPMLSHIPILKRAFTNRTAVKDEQTLLILVSPKILVQPEEEERAYPTLREPAL
jgi:type II secretory pathway component GspD/PulD (secretin)/tetratricopeptide (TPR) repeat protein